MKQFESAKPIDLFKRPVLAPSTDARYDCKMLQHIKLAMVTEQKRIGSSGAWLRRKPPKKEKTRFEWLCGNLKDLASEIEAQAPM